MAIKSVVQSHLVPIIPKPSPTAITRDQVLNELGARRGGRTLEAMAGEIGVTFQYLAHVLAGERAPGDKVLEWLGLRKVTSTWYERVTVVTALKEKGDGSRL